jgi:fructose/tagatose bisphosphate aldolase
MNKKLNIKVIRKDNDFAKRVEARILKKVDKRFQRSSEKMRAEFESMMLQASERNVRRNMSNTLRNVKKSFYSSDSAIFNSFTEQIKRLLLK